MRFRLPLSYAAILWLPFVSAAAAAVENSEFLKPVTPLNHINTSTLLNIAYYDGGPPTGQSVLLIHGFPYSIDAFESVVPILENNGYRVIVPYLRGYGGTTFLHADTFRSAEQAALGSDIVALMDALRIEKSIVAGYDWGTVAANAAVALWPDRFHAMVAANSYLIQDRSTAWVPLDPEAEALRWYYYTFLTPRGAAGLASDPKRWARVLWQKNSPASNFTDEYLDQTATAFGNPDYVEIVLHFYRNRLLYAPGDPKYADMAMQLDKLPSIKVPSVTFDPANSVIFPPTNGSSTAKHFTAQRCHYILPGIGENVPYESPKMFAESILTASKLAADSHYACPQSL